MNKSIFKKFLAGSLAALVSFAASAKDFVVVGSLIEPPWKYYEYNSELEMELLVGIDIDIFREIQRRTNLKFEYKRLEYSRALVELENNNIDILAGVTKSLSEKKALKVPSWPYIEKLPENVYHSSKKQLKTKRYQDLYSYSVGLIRSLSYDDRLDDDPLINKEYSEDGLDLFKKLVSGQIDAIIASDWEAAYFSRLLGSSDDVQVVTDFTLNDTTDRYMAYSAKLPQYIQRKIEEALDQMIEDGTLDRILDKYFKKIHPEAQSAAEPEK